jgi:hypothetical protein
VLLKRMAKPTDNKYVTEVMKLELQNKSSNPQKAAANG